jgi:hypothetical protein
MKKTPPTPLPVSVEINGKAYSGTYTTERDIITVSTAMGHKAAQIGGMTAETLARFMLRELVNEGKA